MADIIITKESVRYWITETATGEFHYKDIQSLRSQLTPELDAQLRRIVWGCCNDVKPIAEPVGRKDGIYRAIQDNAPDIDLSASEDGVDSDLILPFGLRDHCFLYPDTTTVVAGSKSSGKTEFIYQTVKLNAYKKKIVLLSNLEGGVASLRDRFKAIGVDVMNQPFQLKNVNDNFHDYIKEKDTLYCIDYIDAPEGTDFYLIGAQIKKVDQKLQGLNSNAVIGIQKPSDRDTGFGGEQTLKSATLYIALDHQHLKLIDVKVPAIKGQHPKNRQWRFTISDNGGGFENITEDWGAI